MKKLVGVLVLGSATLGPACTDAPTHVERPPTDPPSEPQGSLLESRREAGTVNGSNFVCTGNWPNGYTPCNYPWSTRAVTSASGADGRIALHLERNVVPNDHEAFPTDGGGSTVFLYLDLNTPDGAIRAMAREFTLGTAGDQRIEETSDPIAGWINPIVLSRSPEGRNAGKFSLTFTWGSIRGTYDTDPPTP